jgi:hypothetical protein
LLQKLNESFEIAPFLKNQITEEEEPFIENSGEKIDTFFEPERSN